MTTLEQSRIIIISGPSGVGKSTLIKELLQKYKDLEFSISTTTRTIRPNEKEGKDYYFVDHSSFKKKIENNDFLEYAKVHNHYYGTSKEAILSVLSKNNHTRCILDIDVQGALWVSRIYPFSKRIFLLPPSLHILKERLYNRGDTEKNQIEIRLQNAIKEISYIHYYNFFVVNTKTHEAINNISQYIYDPEY